MEIIRSYPVELDPRTRYKLTKSPDVKRMKDAKDSVLPVKNWIHYIDDSSGEEKEVLAISTTDDEIFATISPVFMKEFFNIIEVFGDDPGEIKVFGGKTRAGREFIACTIV